MPILRRQQLAAVEKGFDFFFILYRKVASSPALAGGL
jgi:hypothetical protein